MKPWPNLTTGFIELPGEPKSSLKPPGIPGTNGWSGKRHRQRPSPETKTNYLKGQFKRKERGIGRSAFKNRWFTCQ
ncbi:MAG: hypothetical protein CSA81_02040 [Acidobacteria bacterium]|nr:MAG: hypothetical protein CSA81_02040 [Acidobacteriota bacterium]